MLLNTKAILYSPLTPMAMGVRLGKRVGWVGDTPGVGLAARVGVADGKGEGVMVGAGVAEGAGAEASAVTVRVGAGGVALLQPVSVKPIQINMRANHRIFLCMGQCSSLG